MKKILTFVLMMASLTYVTGQARIGGGLSYGTEVEATGLNINGEFFLKSNLAITPEFNYFFIEGNSTYWTLNGDAHFYLNRSSQASFYGLAGINLTTVGGDNSKNALGLNLGAGANFELTKKVTPFVQFKFVTGDYDQGVLSFGIRIDI